MIKWAKRNAFRYYDFEGIDEEAASTLANKGGKVDKTWDDLTRFKLSFGGDARINPPAFAYVHNPLLRYANNAVVAPMLKSSAVNRLVERLKFARR